MITAILEFILSQKEILTLLGIPPLMKFIYKKYNKMDEISLKKYKYKFDRYEKTVKIFKDFETLNYWSKVEALKFLTNKNISIIEPYFLDVLLKYENPIKSINCFLICSSFLDWNKKTPFKLRDSKFYRMIDEKFNETKCNKWSYFIFSILSILCIYVIPIVLIPLHKSHKIDDVSFYFLFTLISLLALFLLCLSKKNIDIIKVITCVNWLNSNLPKNTTEQVHQKTTDDTLEQVHQNMADDTREQAHQDITDDSLEQTHQNTNSDDNNLMKLLNKLRFWR